MGHLESEFRFKTLCGAESKFTKGTLYFYSKFHFITKAFHYSGCRELAGKQNHIKAAMKISLIFSVNNIITTYV